MIISSKNGKADKIHVFIDGEYYLTVDNEFWYTCGYASKSEIEEEELELLVDNANKKRAFNKAVSLLSLRDHSRKELERKLYKTASQPAICYALDKLEEMGYINDAEYAKNLADELLRRKHLAPQAIKSELIIRGIDSDTASEVASSINVDTQQALEELLQTKFASKLSDEKSRKRTYNALLRMGYSHREIISAMDIDSY